ncbi:DUF2252 domain-containing protein [Dokdonella sp.]|uniref:DUF2252 domain-containing protein n=1 Tax=Dokdonella sp. TaxID=2291710 RepID=UPI002619B1A6|nr:DUF2252 domain-containing protein [Dokdonella sp.]
MGSKRKTDSPRNASPPEAPAAAEQGRALRKRIPRKAHSVWKVATRGRDVIGMLRESERGRIAELLPIRHARMLQSPFAFYRGGAAIMAHDLARTPATGLRVQAGGDCHPANFGGFATPERRVLFDLNDFDETLPAPWEWDLKRLAAGFVVAGRGNGLGDARCREIAEAAVRGYSESLREAAGESPLDAWYRRVDLDALPSITGDPSIFEFARRDVREALADAHVDAHVPLRRTRGGFVLVDKPPLLHHPTGKGERRLRTLLDAAMRRYRVSLPDERRVLFDRYRLADLAIKVVGIGSVGTLCAVALFVAGRDDTLLLQVKEARRSVLEPYAGRSRYPDHGQRVVVGQRLMQAASDLFLGWCPGPGSRHFYVRQLNDAKLKPLLERFDARQMAEYACVCGTVLANAHARSGPAPAIAAYLGGRHRFARRVADFAAAYADQNEADYARFRRAVKEGAIDVGDAAA